MIGLENLVLLIKLPSASVLFVVSKKVAVAFILTSQLSSNCLATHTRAFNLHWARHGRTVTRTDGTEFHLGDDRIYAKQLLLNTVYLYVATK